MKITDYSIPNRAWLVDETVAIAARTREVAARSFELLDLSAPDTFLGRQHYPLLLLPHEKEE